MRVAVVVKNLTMGGMQKASINLSEMFANEGHETHLIYFKSKRVDLFPGEQVKLHLFALEEILKKTVIGAILNILAKLTNIFIRYSYFIWQGFLLTPIFKYKFKQLEKEYGKFDLIIIRGQGSFEMIWNYNDDRLLLQQVNILRKRETVFNNFYLQKLFNYKNIMCNSQSVYIELINDFKEANVIQKSLKIIPSPINPENIYQKSLEYTPAYSHTYIVYVGRFSDAKNVSLLIESFSYAKVNLNLLHKLVLVGDGERKPDYIQQITKLNIVDDVHFTGSLSNPYPWVRKADLFAFTSFHEGLPNVLLEALSCETNIVATRGRGGTLDIMSGELKNNLTNFDKIEFAQKIIEVLNTKKKINFQQHLQKYKPTSVVLEYLKLSSKDK